MYMLLYNKRNPLTSTYRIIEVELTSHYDPLINQSIKKFFKKFKITIWKNNTFLVQAKSLCLRVLDHDKKKNS